MTVGHSQSFKYKATFAGKREDAINNTNSSVKNTKIVVLWKYLWNVWRLLEIPLINSKIHLELNWIEDSILSSAGESAKCKLADAKFYVPISTLSLKAMWIWKNN